MLEFQKRRLNTCAHCKNKVTKIVFSTDGRLYFICKSHGELLSLLQTISGGLL